MIDLPFVSVDVITNSTSNNADNLDNLAFHLDEILEDVMFFKTENQDEIEFYNNNPSFNLYKVDPLRSYLIPQEPIDLANLPLQVSLKISNFAM